MSTELSVRDRNILTLDVASPEELKAVLPQKIRENRRRVRVRYITLGVTEGQVFVCPFFFSDTAPGEIEDRVSLKAVELLNMSLDRIVLDYQVFGTADQTAWGVFGCMPQALAEQYLHILDTAGIPPLRLVPSSVVSLNTICKSLPSNAGRICILDLSRQNVASACVLQEERCEMYREIPYDNVSDAVQDIDQTLYSISARSRIKQLDRILYHGDSHQAKDIVDRLSHKLNRDIEPHQSNGMARIPKQNVLSINLLKEYSLSLSARSKIIFVVNIIYIILVFFSLSLGMKISRKNVYIEGVKSLYTQTEYKQATQLQKELNSL